MKSCSYISQIVRQNRLHASPVIAGGRAQGHAEEVPDAMRAWGLSAKSPWARRVENNTSQAIARWLDRSQGTFKELLYVEDDIRT